jgi:hypothetical protein
MRDRAVVVGLVALCSWLAPLSGSAQLAPNNIVIRPTSPTSSTAISIDVPVMVCFHSDPLTFVRSSSVQIVGSVISISVDLVGFSCFSAGDPVVPKAITFSLAPLPIGSYTVNYVASSGNIITHQETAGFAVLSDPVAAIPTLSAWNTLLLAAILAWTAYARRRVP